MKVLSVADWRGTKTWRGDSRPLPKVRPLPTWRPRADLDSPAFDRLADMLSAARPAGSETEDRFVQYYIVGTAAWCGDSAETDAFGNVHVVIGSPTVLYSSHTDTVARTHGRQRVEYWNKYFLSGDASDGSPGCLGADDTAGIWIMLEMIRARKPGHYVFHYGEETGGIGSSKLAASEPEWLHDCQVAIAFDRRGTSDVITSQFGGRCCSDTVAVAIADQLTAADPGLLYRPASGTYTDTAEYTDTIAECTNLSVGYEHEHTKHEILSWRHVKRLARAVCSDAWHPEAIEPVRDPSVRVNAWDDFVWRGWDDIYGAHNRPEANDRTYRRAWDRLSDLPEVETAGAWYTGSCALCETVSDRLNEDGACLDCAALFARM